MTLPGMVSHYFTTNSISLVLFDGFQALTQVISAFLRAFFCRLLCLSLCLYQFSSNSRIRIYYNIFSAEHCILFALLGFLVSVAKT